MLIVGERINTSRKAISPAVEKRDLRFIQNVARKQAEAGANMLDVNCGTLGEEEPEALAWLVKTVQEAVDLPLCIDSPNPVAVKAALEVHKGLALVNSITAERERFRRLVPIIRDHGSSVVALCMDDDGIPETPEGRLDVARRLMDALAGEGVAPERIYFDPLVRPISTGSESGVIVLETIRALRKDFPGAHVICGLSNVSFGLPARSLLNQAFLLMCMASGLDAVILDPQDSMLMALLLAGEALLARDQFCMNYIAAHRAGKLGV